MQPRQHHAPGTPVATVHGGLISAAPGHKVTPESSALSSVLSLKFGRHHVPKGAWA